VPVPGGVEEQDPIARSGRRAGRPIPTGPPRQWGERHAIEPGTPYRPLIDTRTREPLARVGYVRPDGTPLHHAETRLGDPRPMEARSGPATDM
jgi:hypothetical protein